MGRAFHQSQCATILGPTHSLRLSWADCLSLLPSPGWPAPLPPSLWTSALHFIFDTHHPMDGYPPQVAADLEAKSAFSARQQEAAEAAAEALERSMVRRGLG